jgi:dethiobiotin synthetase
MASYFITGIGTDVGKTVISAILAEALQADYWKPVQAGYENGTDSIWLREMISNKNSVVHQEIYKLKLAASPHIAAEEEGIEISTDKIINDIPVTANTLLIEGAGGLMVPLNKNEFVFDLIKKLDSKVIIVSRNYLGSINHSLLTANFLKQNSIKVLGWIFNGDYLDYENEIVDWSGFPWIASVRQLPEINKEIIHEQAAKIKAHLNLFI